MASSTKVVDPAFEGVGQNAGLNVWRIEKFQPVPVPQSDVGKFYTGDSYIVLKTTVLKSGAYQYDVHFWLGKATSQDEAGTAAIKTVELDAALEDRAVQYREVQGHETDKFLSYFKPCIIPLEGGVASGFKQVEKDKFEPRLYIIEGRRVVRVKQIPYCRSSLNHDDVFIVDTESKIYQFNGSTSNIQERAKALEVVQYIKDTYHDGKCEVAVIDDGEPDGEVETGEFWSLFGGFAPIGNRAPLAEDNVCKASKLYIVEEGQLNHINSTPLTKEMLESDKCYVLDCGVEIYVWTGRSTSLEERKGAMVASEELLSSQGRPKHTLITKVIQGFETLPFRTNFDLWPLGDGAADGRSKLEALSRHQEVSGRGIAKEALSKEEIPPLFDSNGKLEVWRIDGSTKILIDSADVGKFFSGDCYVVLYTYAGEQRDEYFICHWIGKTSTEEDQAAVSHLLSELTKKYEGRPVQGHIVEGKEPHEFVGLFQNFCLLKGGLSSGYQNKVLDKGLADETYKDDGEALFQVQGAGPHDSKAVQIDLDAEGLNSSYCYILTNSNSVFIWNGVSSTLEEQQLAVKMAEFLKPGTTPEVLEEGSEPSEFWNPLGGRKSYACHREAKGSSNDPRLFACSIQKGKLETQEVFNFTQNDLLSEDVMILDAHNVVFVWIGQNADQTEKQQSMDMAQTYVKQAAALEGLPEKVSLYKVTEGNEPFFFTKHFDEWDPVKASMQGDSFQKKLSALFGKSSAKSEVPKTTGTGRRADVEALSSSLSASNITKTPSEFISYERLRASSDDPAPGVDPERRESYLSPEEFEKLFGMDSERFHELPKWKQEMQKRTLDLF